ncbi:MAG: PrsW family glutamic-type intramembrane protease [Patescibacteria group bacterium]
MAALELIFSPQSVLVIALGIVPPILWLLFWLREDHYQEPKREIVFVFFAGMLSGAAALVFEIIFLGAISIFQKVFAYSPAAFQILNLIGFALIEELSKTGAAFFTAIKSKYFDEPEDGIVYLITAALGFAAMENVLFIAGSLKVGISQSLIVSAFRFINAVMLHVSSAAIIGAGFAFSFYHKTHRNKDVAFAIAKATLLHALYNYLIIKNIESAVGQFSATILVIGGAIIALVLFEKARRLHKQNLMVQ